MTSTSRGTFPRTDHLIVISQLPPPVHGSTVMTEVFLESVERLGIRWSLVDRRFSLNIGDVGRITIRKAFSALGLVLRLLNAIRLNRDTQVVFFCTTRPVSFFVDWLLSEVLRVFQAPTINYIHTQGYGDLASRNVFFRFMVRRLLGVASQTVCLSPVLYADISNWVSVDTVHFIANTPRNMPTALTETAADPRRVTFLSNFIPGKGVEAFIQIAIQLSGKYPDVIFDVVGAPTDEDQASRLQRLVSVAGIEASVNFAGAVHGEEKWRYLGQSSLLVFPSQLVEAQPLTIVEAFACGTPVVAFKVGGIVDLIDHGETGLLVEPTQEALLRAVDSLLSSPQLLAELGFRAAAEFDRRFSADIYQEQWSRVVSVQHPTGERKK